MVVNTMLPKCCQAVAARAVPMLLTVRIGAGALHASHRAGANQATLWCRDQRGDRQGSGKRVRRPGRSKIDCRSWLYAKYYEGCVQDAKLASASFYEAADQCGAQVSTSAACSLRR